MGDKGDGAGINVPRREVVLEVAVALGGEVRGHHAVGMGLAFCQAAVGGEAGARVAEDVVARMVSTLCLAPPLTV